MPEPGALFSDIRLAGRRSLIAAVSGGGDSLALLLLLHDYLKCLPERPSLVAVTVDHGLRSESAAEARAVGELAAARGIAHRTLRWEGAKPASGISVAAREARFSLLAHAARQAGTDMVLTAHTADDQAETVAMRSSRGQGRGTAGIAPATLYDGDVWFLRPLLQARRATLRAFLSERDIGWFEDPSNRDARFERARVRLSLDEARTQLLLGEARDAQRRREEEGRSAAHLIRNYAQQPVPGLLRFSLQAASDPEAGLYTFRILLAAAGGASHLPDEERSAEILRHVLADGRRASLSRAIMTRKGDWLYLHRELRNLPEKPLVRELVWDGRYRISTESPQPDTRIAPFGTVNAAALDLPAADTPTHLLLSAQAAEPAAWVGDQCVGLAQQMKGFALRPLAAPWAKLLPSFDLAPAAALLGLMHGEPPPALPFDGHKGHNE